MLRRIYQHACRYTYDRTHDIAQCDIYPRVDVHHVSISDMAYNCHAFDFYSNLN